MKVSFISLFTLDLPKGAAESTDELTVSPSPFFRSARRTCSPTRQRKREGSAGDVRIRRHVSKNLLYNNYLDLGIVLRFPVGPTAKRRSPPRHPTPTRPSFASRTAEPRLITPPLASNFIAGRSSSRRCTTSGPSSLVLRFSSLFRFVTRLSNPAGTSEACVPFQMTGVSALQYYSPQVRHPYQDHPESESLTL